MSVSVRSTTSGQTSAGGADSAVSLTISAVSGSRIALHRIDWSYSTTPTSGNLLVSLGTAAVFQLDIRRAGNEVVIPEIRSDPGVAATLTLAGGGTSVSGVLNASWDYII